jgi:hypothetical protein
VVGSDPDIDPDVSAALPLPNPVSMTAVGDVKDWENCVWNLAHDREALIVFDWFESSL